jgi:hypothetical protein
LELVVLEGLVPQVQGQQVQIVFLALLHQMVAVVVLMAQ